MQYDILIVGGGMVGGSLASALAQQPFKVGVVEAVPPAAMIVLWHCLSARAESSRA